VLYSIYIYICTINNFIFENVDETLIHVNENIVIFSYTAISVVLALKHVLLFSKVQKQAAIMSITGHKKLKETSKLKNC